VKIRFTEQQPAYGMECAAAGEYGFYAQREPEGRSSALESSNGTPHRRTVSSQRADHTAVNGYAEDVAGLYQEWT